MSVQQLIESLDLQSVNAAPMMKEKWTPTLQYFGGHYEKSGKDYYYIFRFENKWHEGGVKIGKYTWNMTFHEMNLGDPKKSTSKRISKIRHPLQFVACALKALEKHYNYNTVVFGYMTFMPPKAQKVTNFIGRVAKRSSALRIMQSKTISLSGVDGGKLNPNGSMIFFNTKALEAEQVFTGVMKKIKKFGVYKLDDIGENDMAVAAFVNNNEKAATKTRALRFNFEELYYPGTTTSYNKEFRAPRDHSPDKMPPAMQAGYAQYEFDKMDIQDEEARAYAISRSVSDNWLIEDELHTDIKDMDHINAIKAFTGSQYGDMRKMVFGAYSDPPSGYDQQTVDTAIQNMKRLDSTFDSIGHNLEFYKGYLFRGVDISGYSAEQEWIRRFLVEDKTALPTYTSFTTRVEIACSFGNFSAGAARNFFGGDKDNYRQFSSGADAVAWIESQRPDKELWKGTTLSYEVNSMNIIMFSRQDFSQLQCVIPGEISQYETEREIILSRGTMMEAVNYWLSFSDDGRITGFIEYDIVGPPSRARMEEFNYTEPKGFSRFIAEAKRPKKATKPKKEKDRKYTKEEFEELKIKFGSNPFHYDG